MTNVGNKIELNKERKIKQMNLVESTNKIYKNSKTIYVMEYRKPRIIY